MATFSVDAPLPPELDASTAACWSFKPEELTPRSSWRLLGEGSFGCVFLARWLGQPVAVKVNANEKANRYEGLLRDIKYLRSVGESSAARCTRCALPSSWRPLTAPVCRLQRQPAPQRGAALRRVPDAHQAVCRHGCVSQGSRGAAVPSSGTLTLPLHLSLPSPEYMQHTLRDRRVVNKVDLVSVLADVARALVRCHSTGHIHRDVKARNVLVSADFRVAKLADFGLARPLVRDAQSAQFRRRAQVAPAAAAAAPGLVTDEDNVEEESDPRRGGMTPRVGPRKYRAPEVEEGLCYGCPCDVYSFGVMIRELLAVLKRRTARRYGVTIDFLGELSMLCMRTRPEGRPSAGEALALLQQHKDEALPSAMVAGISPQGVLHAHRHEKGIQGGGAANGNAVITTREHSPSSSWERKEGHGVKRCRSQEEAYSPSGTTDAVIFLAAQRGGPPPLDSDGETSASKGSREERAAKAARRSRSANR